MIDSYENEWGDNESGAHYELGTAGDQGRR